MFAKKGQQDQKKAPKEEETKVCPSCRRAIPKYSFECPHCGRIFVE